MDISYVTLRFNYDPCKVATDAEVVALDYAASYKDAVDFMKEYTWKLGKDSGLRVMNNAVKFCPLCYGVEDGCYADDMFNSTVMNYYEDLNQNFGIAVVRCTPID